MKVGTLTTGLNHHQCLLIMLRSIIFELTGNRTWVLQIHSQATYPLSYRAIDIIYVKIDFYISPQTLDQYWSTLVYIRTFVVAPSVKVLVAATKE